MRRVGPVSTNLVFLLITGLCATEVSVNDAARWRENYFGNRDNSMGPHFSHHVENPIRPAASGRPRETAPHTIGG